MAGALWNKVKAFGSAVKANSVASNYVNRAVKWGAIGGAVGGVAEWAGGGSFFEGAKSGAFQGAVAGAGYTAFKAGRSAATKFTTRGAETAEEFSRKTRAAAHGQAVSWRANNRAGRGQGGGVSDSLKTMTQTNSLVAVNKSVNGLL